MPAITITPKQMSAFEASRLDDFRQAMKKHLRETVGGAFASQSDDSLLAFINNGVKRAQAYGATENLAFGNFIVLAATFGDDFDTNSTYPWAQETLKGKAAMDGNTRIESLAAQFAFYLSNSSADQGPSEQTTGGVS